jgi:hypothetical protein
LRTLICFLHYIGIGAQNYIFKGKKVKHPKKQKTFLHNGASSRQNSRNILAERNGLDLIDFRILNIGPESYA